MFVNQIFKKKINVIFYLEIGFIVNGNMNI